MRQSQARAPAKTCMMRRKQKNIFELPTLLVVGVVGLLLVLLFWKVAILLALIVAGAFVAVIVVLPARHRRSFFDKANAVIVQHADQLARRRAQLVRADAYGKPIFDKWVEEINYFVSQHVEPKLTTGEQSVLIKNRASITQWVIQRVEEVTCNRPAFEAFSEKLTPTEFEAYCADQLRQSGWNAHVTRQSRDQGVDVIAEKNGVRIVLQCKLYSNPVGNKAVQEAAAARAFEQAHYCAVVSNSSYTSAAEQLAATNSVLLLHYSDLRRVETLLREPRSA
jgi:restriction system protein